ncbi:Golgi resident protein GCP60-like [Scleropages formosus]|uniref:Golgi resident protein GCP60 n=1 Tax=Scleropages formosus TaxID=113540 RepID=A0A0P7YI24_SCLFO|nr:Golgi resident protein GCP60-like [Scleropages formosus]
MVRGQLVRTAMEVRDGHRHGRLKDPVEAECERSCGGDGEEGEHARAVLLGEWGFSLEELYSLALRFFREKEGKAFHPLYEEKLRLVALHKQVLLGPYHPDSCPEVGFFDVLGNDRRKEWVSLGNMSKEDAMTEFVKLLNKCCSLFAPFVTSHKIEKEEQERKRCEEEQRRRLEEEEQERRRQEEERQRREEEQRLQREEEERRQAEEERERLEQQKQQIMVALNAQTAAALNKQQEVTAVAVSAEARRSAVPPGAGNGLTANGAPAESLDKEVELDSVGELMENSPRGPVFTVNLHSAPAATTPLITAPSMWTRPQIKDFKEKIRQDPDSVITVGRGEVVTVRVPTHQEGSYLFWEFATDHYDVGFGVYFEWSDSPSTAVSIHVSDSSDEDEECEGQSEEEKAQKLASKPQVDEVVPVYRRDCHEEVYAGSHQYPGRGIYLLKFDNSYSLWRSKSVYYRVYYTR